MSLKTARFVRIVGPSNDKGPYKLINVDSDGHEIEAYVMESSGFSSAPMTDGIAIAFPIAGDEGKVVILPLAPAKDRYDGLAEGEAKMGNLKKGTVIHFDDAGNIVLTGKVIINGNMEFNGDIAHDGSMTTSGVHTDSTGPHTA